MAWLALLLALVALPWALLDLRIAVAGLALAGALAGRSLARGRRRRVSRATLAIVLAGAALAGYAGFELYRPVGDPAPAAGAYQRPAGDSRAVLLPLRVEVGPVARLALLEFAESADPILTGLEPQFIDRGYEQGFRVIAYRRDGFVDIYDDLSLTVDPAERSQVTGRGVHRHLQVEITDALIDTDAQGRAQIGFAFTDADGRQIRVKIIETTTRSSVPTNLLAPVGLSSTDPDYFPLFNMNDFRFIRSGGTTLDVRIDAKPIELAAFPVPIPVQGHQLSFAKYTLDPEIIAVFPTTQHELQRVTTLPGTDRYEADGVSYLFDGPALERILVLDTEVVFSPALDITRAASGTVTITSHPDRGVLHGEYRVDASSAASNLELDFTQVTVPRQPDLIFRLIVNRRTVFGTWPLGYSYRADFDLVAGRVEARWRNQQPG